MGAVILPGYGDIQMKGKNSHWNRKGMGEIITDFLPSSTFQMGGGDFCPYLALIRSVMALVCDGNLFIMLILL